MYSFGLARYTDMESEDYPFFQGLVYLLENDVSTLGYELTFSTEVCESSLVSSEELVPCSILAVHNGICPQGFKSQMLYVII